MDWTAFFAQYLPPQKNAPWTPSYLPQQYVSEPNNSGGIARQPLNIYYFPDGPTAAHLRDKYGAATISHQDFLGAGPDAATAPIYYLVWANGVAIMAGALAALWSLNPGHQDTADKLCLDAIAARGAV